jgi:hydrophobe/amphiphile efflux-3 (HAE3) family protein
VRNLLARIAAAAVERPTPVIVLVTLLCLLGAAAALRLEADAGTDTLVDRGSEAFGATEEFKSRFGDDAVVILVKGDLRRLMLSEDLGRLLGLESCLSGNSEGGRVFGAEQEAPRACARIAALNPSRVVYGPATFLNQFAIQAERLFSQQSEAAQASAQQAGQRAAERAKRQGASTAAQQQAAQAASSAAMNQFLNQLIGLGARYGLTGLPRLDDPQYVSSVVFEGSDSSEPKARFAYLFPSKDAALISVRLRPELSESDRQEAIELFRDAVAEPAFALEDGEYVVSGVPVVVDGLREELSSQIFILLAGALVVMAITLALVFGPPLRLLPLAIALGASGITFGALSLVGGSLTMASLAVLPVLIGLAVDYAIQFQARFVEAARGGSSPARAAVEAAARGGPVIATAGLATVAGFLVLLLSPIPMVRGFGALLVAGVAIAFALAVTAGLATLSLTDARGGAPGSRFVPARLATARARAGERLGAFGKRALALSVAAPGRVLAAAAVLAVGGWVAGTRTEVISDLRELVPADLPALENVDELQEATGVSGEVDVTVTAPDLGDPAVIAWMRAFEERVLARHGFGGEFPSCRDPGTELCPAISLPDLFSEERPTRSRIETVLNLLPPYFSQAVISRDPERGGTGGTAVIAFGIRVMPFDEQKELIDDIRAQIDPPGANNDPPDGVAAEVVGLPVLAADANSALSDNRYLLVGAGLAAVALALLAAYRSARRALVPLIPIVLATGWSSLILWLTGVPLNPMSATLGALVIAIATEFSVILSARYWEERGSGGSVGEALRRAYSRTGAAVLASGTTAVAGFAVLVLSEVRMLRDFGLVTVLDLAVALAGVMLVLPAALVWAEGGFEPLGSLVSRLRGRSPAPLKPRPEER